MPLIVNAGHATLAGLRERNEDFVGMVTPNEPELSSKGLIAAIADGVSGNEGGREASEYAVRGLLTDYYATPDTWPITQSLDRVIKAINSWVQQQGSVRTELVGMASTLTALVLRGRFYHFAHVGDTRLYLLRAGVLSRLTSDHVWDRPEMQHVLTRAIGLDSRLAIDHGMGEMREGDVFLLATDGVWGSMTEYDITSLLSEVTSTSVDINEIAVRMLQAALAAGSSDNLTVQILKVATLPEENLRDALSVSHQLPLPPKLKVGQTLDGYLVEEQMHSSRITVLYRVVDTRLPPAAQRKLVLKTLQPECVNDIQERSAFAHEEWLAKRTVARFFPQVIPSEQKNYLYYLSTWHAGHTIAQALSSGEHFTVPDVISHGIKLARAIGALHRRSIIHRDIKPDNVHLGDDGELRILDLGVAQSGLEANDEIEAHNISMAGTPSFLAPELFDNPTPSRQTDVYAAGVTLYLMLTRHYPYGEIEAFQRPRFGETIPPTRYRPDLPMWLENVLLKSVARDPIERFETAEEFLLALERGATRPLAARSATPLVKRDPASLWRAVAATSIVLNLLLIYLVLVR